ncbi:uncharacterized protein LOC114226117 [Eumetopias jubatus]|uniref:uncharacterized protein LOC114226117 n=1 Tax=Eumetopias jubatus TaxID=34886 RepID=UPI0010161B45|nr:uncharacterized protein LOC114226117 [Eumetopias jubatus]
MLLSSQKTKDPKQGGRLPEMGHQLPSEDEQNMREAFKGGDPRQGLERGQNHGLFLGEGRKSAATRTSSSKSLSSHGLVDTARTRPEPGEGRGPTELETHWTEPQRRDDVWTPPESETLARGTGDNVLEPCEATVHKQSRPEAKSSQAYPARQPPAPTVKASLRKLGQEGVGRRSVCPPPPGAQTSHPLPDPKCFRKTKPVARAERGGPSHSEAAVPKQCPATGHPGRDPSGRMPLRRRPRSPLRAFQATKPGTGSCRLLSDLEQKTLQAKRPLVGSRAAPSGAVRTALSQQDPDGLDVTAHPHDPRACLPVSF